jgi:hypothetical protein
MPKRPRGEKHPADRVGQAVPVAGTATGETDHNTPEEDALEKAARAVVREGEAARDVGGGLTLRRDQP